MARPAQRAPGTALLPACLLLCSLPKQLPGAAQLRGMLVDMQCNMGGGAFVYTFTPTQTITVRDSVHTACLGRQPMNGPAHTPRCLAAWAALMLPGCMV
jgi:hypothetical protein